MRKRWGMPPKHGNMMENHNAMRMLEGYGHMLPIIRSKHCKNKKGLLTTCYRGPDISSKKIEMIMKTTINFYGKVNEVISWCTFCVWMCFFFKWQLLLLRGEIVAPNHYCLLGDKTKGTRSTPYYSIERITLCEGTS